MAALPIAGQSRALLTFGAVTDLHYADIDPSGTRVYRESDTKLAEFVRTMNDRHADFVIELGDFKDQDKTPVDASSLGYLRHIEQVLAGFTGPRYHVLGNHDLDSLSKAQYLGAVSNGSLRPAAAHYTFVTNGIRSIVLDADHKADGSDYDHGNFQWYDTNIDQAQMAWLESTLASSREPVLVFVHQPLDGNIQPWVANAPAVRAVLEKSRKVIGVFQGHIHEGNYNVINGIPYVTLKGVTEGAGPANNPYVCVDVAADLSVWVTGFHREDSRGFRALTADDLLRAMAGSRR